MRTGNARRRRTIHRHRPAGPVRIVISSPQPLFLDGLEAVVCSEPQTFVVGRCADADAFRRAILRLAPDIAFLDMDLSAPESWQVVRDLKDAPTTRLVLLTPRLDNDALLEAVRLGIRGVLPRSADSSLIIDCLRRVRDGGLWLDKQMTATALRAKVRGEATRRQLAQVGLTPRELEIAALVGEGKAVVVIAARLNISPGTVNVHLQRAYRKLGVSDRLSLIVYTRRRAVAVA